MPTRVYIPTEPYTPTGESMYAQPAPDNALLAAPEQQSALSRGINRLLGTQFGEERYQTWPEKMVRSAATLAGDVLSGAVPVAPPGLRREDVTDEPAPGVDSNAPWWKVSRWVPPVAAQPNDLMMERAQDLAGVAMGGGIGGTGKAAAAGEAVLGSGPVRNANGTRRINMSKYNQDFETAGILFDQADAWRATGAKPEVATLDPKTLRSTQNTFEEGIGHGGGFKGMNDKPLVARTPDGKMHILDGHHRLEKAAAEGKKLDSYVIDLPGEASINGPTLRSDSQAGTGIQAVKNAPAWYSAVEHALEQSTTGSAPGAQWLATLRNSRGVKPEEMAWLGLDDYLAAAQVEGRKVTRAELQDYVKSHAVELRDVAKGEKAQAQPWESLTSAEKDQVWTAYQHESGGGGNRPSDSVLRDFYNMDPEEFGVGGQTKYHDYQLPGGENYREHLITMPSKNINDRVRAFAEKEGIDNISEAYAQYEARHGSKLTGDNYKSSHWEEPNILAHVRTNDRVIDGKKSLHLEEVQSDWHQQGRDKGYKTGERPATSQEIEQGLARTNRDGELVMGAHGVPDAPFKKTWHELALKRMLRRAAEEGYERLSWTPGDAQAARYDLSKTFSDVLTTRKKDGSFSIAGKRSGRDNYEPLALDVSQEKLMDYVGKELASKIAKDYEAVPADAFPVQQQKSYSGVDLKIGGEGMRGFYDQILPKALEKIGREHGVKVQRGGVETKSITKTVDDRYSVRGDPKIYSTLEEARKAASEPIFYIDIPQSLRDAAMRRGFPLFSGGKMFVPHQEEDK